MREAVRLALDAARPHPTGPVPSRPGRRVRHRQELENTIRDRRRPRGARVPAGALFLRIVTPEVLGAMSPTP
ncbi:hypothetical protein QJS66_06380 [Kocuria rhizophila]|nr:hypothetical protein QJS66_06380 [Kocuria rhizophila]